MKRSLTLALALAAALPFTAAAHKQWLVPASTVVAGNDVWVTVDAAVSNELFYPDFVPVRLDGITITAPDGSTVQAQNDATGKTRSVFDVELNQQGTYRVANVTNGLSARWGERRGPGAPPAPGAKPDPNSGFLRSVTAEELATKVPKGAKNLEVTENLGRVETFITNGAPTPIKATGKGLELVEVTHPNDLFAGEAAKFKLMVDGQPKAGLEVQVVRGATRYRNAQEDTKVTTDANGEFSVQWAEPGMYWISASTTDNKTTVKQATQRRLSYIATLEALPQ
ncbi:protein of unknown function [Pseudoxanthomonas sp. GM95]|uniref:DUF4198 domain-containing protein n=1 Tax=Pseudoxanthomonas sp. GM95 TaxID=1881043 RepID=UPI0008B82FEC|nr:DUF4198 domain-containing protein [Pseudoxanthomonas sp. GM95]SEL76826.1 protein of unknown function [Pseudoxanthomonas sp. GM95]